MVEINPLKALKMNFLNQPKMHILFYVKVKTIKSYICEMPPLLGKCELLRNNMHQAWLCKPPTAFQINTILH